MKICVLQPDYSTSDVDYQHYDPPRNLSKLIPEATVDHVFLNKLTTYRQLRELRKKNYDIFVNLCEGHLHWDIPSIDVIYTLELLNMPYTGPNTILYDPPKDLMKYVAYCEGVSTPPHTLVDDLEDIEKHCGHLNYPLFVKPSKAGDSLGIDQYSLVNNSKELKEKVASIIDEYGPILIEEYISGREFTVLIAANAENEKQSQVYDPIEYIFPYDVQFKTYGLKTSSLHPMANIPCDDPQLAEALKLAAEKIFYGFGGVGYARMDFRVNEKNEIFFLEVNFTCSVFYTDGYEGSADYILKYDKLGHAGFLKHIIAEGMARHKRKQKKYFAKGNSISGYGIFASQDILPGELIFIGEGRSQRIITRRYVNQTWGDREKANFRKYAYPISKEVFLLWDENPLNWAPQNHSCNPNTVLNGLNMTATHFIKQGEELTIDYATFSSENMEPFHCKCGEPNCRGSITGIANNSITERESAMHTE